MTTADQPLSVRQALELADSLAERGANLQAIDELTKANLELRDPDVARRLVEIRHAAFAELPSEPGRPDWPRPLDDPFPGETGIPTVDSGALTGDLVGGAVIHHGCLQVRGLLDSTTVERLIAHIDHAFEARERVVDGGELADAAPWFVPFEVGKKKSEGFGRDRFVRAVDAPGALVDLAELFTRSGVARAVTDYFGERPAMIANKWVLRHSPSGVGSTDFHQDGAFLGDGIRTIDCWIALSDCGPGTGRPAIDLIPRRFEILPSGEGAYFPWSLAEETVRSAAAGAPFESPVFAAGDALFFDERLPHRTSVGLDLSDRYAVESWFVAPSSYPDRHVPVVL